MKALGSKIKKIKKKTRTKMQDKKYQLFDLVVKGCSDPFLCKQSCSIAK